MISLSKLPYSVIHRQSARMQDQPHEQLYGQDLDILVLRAVANAISLKTFIDVGAEKGGFADALLKMGFDRGIAFEPLPAHQAALKTRFSSAPVSVFPYALDSHDHQDILNIACDPDGKDLDYFHSLRKSEATPYFEHSKTLPVECRSLESLRSQGVIDGNYGLIKIDTEGNDANVLKGFGEVRAQVVVCEFVPPSLYPDWHLSFGSALVARAETLGYRHFAAAKRFVGSEREQLDLDNARFGPDEWGNLIFFQDDVYELAKQSLQSLARNIARTQCSYPPITVAHSNTYGKAFEQWICDQLEQLCRHYRQRTILDVGAHQGDFAAAALRTSEELKAVLFEPNEQSCQQLRRTLDSSRLIVECSAVSSEPGRKMFRFGSDPSTGSLLAPEELTGAAIGQSDVEVVTLDEYTRKNSLLDDVLLLKIDTQGSDADVLRGAADLLKTSRPVVVTELIFAPLYAGQSRPQDILNWLGSQDYVLAGIFDEHYSAQGWLAWCDACFFPSEKQACLSGPFSIKKSSESVAPSTVTNSSGWRRWFGRSRAGVR